MEYLYPDFLDNSDSYVACEHLWTEVIREIEQSLGQENEWTRWNPTTYADGKTPMDRDGSPIVEGCSRAIGRAFQIIQQSPVGARAPLVGAYLEVRRSDLRGFWFPSDRTHDRRRAN